LWARNELDTNNKASIMFTVLFRFTYSDYSILYLQSFTNISVITFQFSIMETVMASFIDEYAFVLRKNWINSAIFRFTVCMSFYLLALPMTTRVCTILHWLDLIKINSNWILVFCFTSWFSSVFDDLFFMETDYFFE
jgi:hypothetical protein